MYAVKPRIDLTKYVNAAMISHMQKKFEVRNVSSINTKRNYRV